MQLWSRSFVQKPMEKYQILGFKYTFINEVGNRIGLDGVKNFNKSNFPKLFTLSLTKKFIQLDAQQHDFRIEEIKLLVKS